MENCKFPRELLIEILVKLPVKSLMRFKCVCKYLYDLIKKDHHLMHKFYEINREKYDYAVIEVETAARECTNKLFGLLNKDSKCDEIIFTCLDIPGSVTRYVSCCDGMLCLILGKDDFDICSLNCYSGDMNFNVLIWNPFIREINALPSVVVPDNPPAHVAVTYLLFEAFGFGVSNSKEWKVVMLWYFDYDPKDIDFTYEIVMVCSQDAGDGSWRWRKIDALPNVPAKSREDFYLRGKYYWRVDLEWCWNLSFSEEHLLWFDLDNEVFGMIQLPTIRGRLSCTVMNETIALVRRCYQRNPLDHIEIWLMSETSGDIEWHKQWSIDCGASILQHESLYPPTEYLTWDEDWNPIGIWNQGGHFYLLAFPFIRKFDNTGFGRHRWFSCEDNYKPYLVSVDLETQEMKLIYLTQESKCVKIVANSSGRYVQVFSESTAEATQLWTRSLSKCEACARIYNPSLQML
ncbi:unnamed protein product [Cuscuta epithymum]|uniref:F-box domain-containing protein n=2 Tax=Cuscuta epithymum TaxID=186058 RepID=A0AAV0EGX0_9ASTE|nr:unnamed protein product [Cuscuta epithymum]